MSRAKWSPQPDQWLISRLDSQVKDKPIDIYFLMQLPSEYAYGHFLVEGHLPSNKEVKSLLKKACKKDGHWPKRVTIAKGDPAIGIFAKELAKNDIELEEQPASYLEPYCRELKEMFSQQFFSPSAFPQSMQKDDVTADEREAAKQFIPDSYDPCPCNSGKKYKFCCKKILKEIILAMAACKHGKFEEGLEWMKKAKSIAGETGEILCRYAVVYSFFDHHEMNSYLSRCLKEFPHHPRAHYIKGVDFKENSQFREAIDAYRKAIANYPPTDKYHLNEVWSNLGSAYFEIREFRKAKEGWEKALLLMPSDRVAKANLFEFIYQNRELSEDLRSVSPFVKKVLGL